MVIVDFFHLCDHATLDYRHAPCLIGVITDFVAPKFPYYRSVITFALLLRGAPNEASRIAFEFGPVDGPQPMRRFMMNHRGTPSGVAFLAPQLTQIVFFRPGEYIGRVLINGEVAATRSVRVVYAGDGPPPTPLPPTGADHSDVPEIGDSPPDLNTR